MMSNQRTTPEPSQHFDLSHLIGEWIAHHRSSQAAFARGVGVSSRAVSDIMRRSFAVRAKGKKPLSVRQRIGWAVTLGKICEKLEVPAEPVIKSFETIGWDSRIEIALRQIRKQPALGQRRNGEDSNDADAVGRVLGDIIQSVRDHELRGRLGATDASELLDCLRGMSDAPFRFDVATLSRDYQRILADSHRGPSTTWSKVWIEWAQKAIRMTLSRINKIAVGQLVLPGEPDTREFWRNVILVNTSSSLWTTNIGDYAGSYGRQNDAGLLEAQRQAAQRVSIERVFVVDSDTIGGELFETLDRQYRYGIKPFTINRRDFESIIQGFPRMLELIGSPDFMIIDNRFVYVTKTDAQVTTVTSALFVQDHEVLEAAIRLKQEIDFKSKPFSATSAGT